MMLRTLLSPLHCAPLAVCVLTSVLLACGAHRAAAQDDVSKLKQDLEHSRRMIDYLQRDNNDLKHQIDDCRKLIDDLSTRLQVVEKRPAGEAPATTPSGEVFRPEESISSLEAKVEKLESSPSLLQHFALQLYGGARYMANSGDEHTSGFEMGNMDLVVNAALADRATAFAEVAFEHFLPVGTMQKMVAMTGEDAKDSQMVSVDLERLYVKYDVSEHLALKIGREHTPFGYWNNAFHHGFYLQTTIERPLMDRFEHDEFSILPSHMVGLSASGNIVSDWGLSYEAYVANGRGPEREHIQLIEDHNENKATGFRIEERFPGDLDGLMIGVSGYFDRVDMPKSTAMAMDDMGMPMEVPQPSSFREMIFGAHAVYESGPWEIIAEYFHLTHYGLDYQDFLGTPKGDGGYLLAAYQVLPWLKPYLMAQYVDVPHVDPYFAGMRDTAVGTVGCRLDVLDRLAIKLEYSRWIREHDHDKESDDLFSTYGIDVSFRF